ncbi:uncharacterized protein LOC122528546 [Frieseomelitta varia]|uniref:uncharacterized protein LOC122528546 n=1 Tax=Frieseomelitta varia TaxID=561572 RepID=UPI001CB67D12|nr:uncharacterized protein LOC122528546 [Frieseomelitta varia]
MKTKSTSVQNFENLVEQTIDGALENNEQMVGKFHDTIYEKWNIKKLSTLKTIDWIQNETTSLESNEQNISATVAHRRFRRRKYKRSSLMIICKMPTDEENSMGQSEMTQVQNLVSTNDKESATNKSDNLNELDEINRPATNDDAKIIELWNNSSNVFAKACKSESNHGLIKQQQSERKLSFEAWKNKKTITYQRILKKIKEEQQQKLLENLANVKMEKIARKAQIRKKQEDRHRRKQKLLYRKHLETIKQTNATISCTINEAKIVNENVLNTSKNEKETKLDEEKRIASSTVRESNSRKNKKALLINACMKNVEFHSWLNQLNWTLHKKYLRERRHLVRSFYCQPFYYGDTTLYIG